MIIDFKDLKNRRFRYSVNKNGKEDGLYRSWHPNGNLIYEINYKNGKFHGLYRYWFDNGKQWLEENYRNGKRHGTYHYWNYKNGKIK